MIIWQGCQGLIRFTAPGSPEVEDRRPDGTTYVVAGTEIWLQMGKMRKAREGEI